MSGTKERNSTEEKTFGMVENSNQMAHREKHSGRRTHLEPRTGAVLTGEHTIHFQMRANPDAEVTVAIGNDASSQVTVRLQDPQHCGIYEAECSDFPFMGPQRLIFRVNGQETFNPAAPMWYYANMLSNYIELPDPETRELIAARPEIAHGQIRHEFYDSRVYGCFVSSLVYTPPGYDPARKYPTLYLFHEVAENVTAWTDAPRMNFLIDNLIAEGKCEPLIVVENDCTVPLDYRLQEDWFENYPALEAFMLKDCIPHMEGAYSLRTDKWGRAVAGLGLGAVQAAYLGMRNTGVFGSIGLFTAFWISSDFHARGLDDPLYTAAQAIGEHPGEIDVFYRSEGDLDPHFGGIEEENRLLAALGVDQLPGYVFKVYHQTHNWGSYRRSLRDFLPLLFHRA